jgi:cytoskeletal protein CcmA (bactofilin family)
VAFVGGLRIDGTVRGSVRATDEKTATLVLSEQARVEGAVEARHIVINGTVAGPVTASEYVELMPKARVTGDVTYKAIEIHSGAIVMGRLQHQTGTRADKVVDIKSATAAAESAR